MSESIRTDPRIPLFVESLEDAIEATAAACGGKKAFACDIRPDLADEPEKAHRWLLDALNTERRTEFHAEHLRRACVVARKADCHILKHWFDSATGYQPTSTAPQMTEQQKLARRRLALAEELAKIADEEAALERSAGMAEIRRLKS